jgi:hypothetical protein
MSIGNGLSFSTAAALAGINASSLGNIFGTGGSDSPITSGVNSLTTSSGFYQPTYTYTPTYTPTTINDVTSNGFGSSTNSFYTPTNSIFTGGNTFGTNSAFTNQLPGSTTRSGSTTGINFNGSSSKSNILDTGSGTSSRASTLPPVNKSALDVAGDISGGLGTDPPG